ncbi:transposase, partial [mine drainage metagenome]
EHPADPKSIKELLRLLDEWLVDQPDLRRMIAIWLRATLMCWTEYSILLPEVNDLQELRVMLSDRLEEWAHQYKAEGMQQG